MAKFFRHFFEDEDFDAGSEIAVKCPYPHYTTGGVEYQESNSSASVNVDKDVFHCMRCGASKSEVGFIADQLGCSYENASKVQRIFNETHGNIYNWTAALGDLPDDVRLKANTFGISDSVLDMLNVRSTDGSNISFPVTMYDKLLDVRKYNPGGHPKVKSDKGALSGLVIPFDIWRTEPKNKWTLLVAGEKDMAVARSLGFKAITLTGGEGVNPIFMKEFKDRKIAIFYDNDDAGRQGAVKLAASIKEHVQSVKVVTNFHEVCIGKGEDFTDLVVKYGATKENIMQMVASTPEFTEEDALEELERQFPTISLFEASKPTNISKTVRSNIQVVAVYESTFSIPTSVTATKITNDDGELRPGTVLNWDLGERNTKDILHLMDNNFKEKDITFNLKNLLGIPPKEKGMQMTKASKETVFKCSVTDLFESTSKETMQMEYTAYSIGKKLESGKKYKATYQVVPHPYNGQQLVMIITDIDNAADTVSGFTVTEEVKESLDVFRNIPGNVSDKITTLTEKVKGIVGFDANDTLIQAIDLTYHTVLEFHFGERFKNTRGYLDTLIVTESRVGKSSISEALRETYNLGVPASLAGGSATKAGLIGGANKVNGSYQTRAGLIPQNHRGLIIFEELAKCNSDILRELTDVRSSNEVRIVRVNGALYLPALVRMLTLTNVKSNGTVSRPISSYPNGIEIVLELIGAAEDIARYDLMLVLGTPGSRNMNFNWVPDTPFEQKDYQTRIRWVWSRTPEQVILTNDVLQYIVDSCNELNNEFDSHIKIFGTEAWKKVTRLAVAVAGYVVSTDETYENIIVTKECVDYAVDFMKQIYDNETFRLKQYVDRERSFSEINQEGIDYLQDVYLNNAALLDQLEQSSYSSRNELMAATGQSQDDFNAVMNTLIRGLFVRYRGQNIMPTERFRKGMRLIDRLNSRPRRVGEEIGAINDKT